MRGRDVDGPCIGGGDLAGADIKPARVDPDRHQLGTRGGQSLARRGIARIFNPDRVLGVKQRSYRHVDGLLRSRQNNNLVIGALNSARGTEIPRDLAA